ncbi:FAD-binding protein [Rhodobacterales bacterium HKCCE2091]|nr:FAD-binding protein [Rhodobacterales bacterium HKCCE2091]
MTTGTITEPADVLAKLLDVVGEHGLHTGSAGTEAYLTDWSGEFSGSAIAIVRPSTTEEVSRVVSICAASRIAITAQGGNTGLAGGSVPAGNRPHVLLSLNRMKTIRSIDTVARCATVDAGVVLQTLQERVAEDGLIFPLMFGARGSCTIGGNLATNAGGSNVLRYGNARAQCLGIEAVLADGSVVSDLSGVRKDNTGYDLRDLLIGSEGTLGIITGATVRLCPAPVATATAFLSLRDVEASFEVLNRLQDVSGGLVEAFEYMPGPLVDLVCEHIGCRQPLEVPAETGILLEIASSRPADAEVNDDGEACLDALLTEALADLMEDGAVQDAVIAGSGQHRAELWKMREAVAESLFSLDHCYIFDIALPLSEVSQFIRDSDTSVSDAGFQPLTVAHMGDGNLHYALVPARGADWSTLPLEDTKTAILENVSRRGGSFSAEHGIGASKLSFMRRYRSQERLDAMRKIKHALDPQDILNPGKTIPQRG